MNDVDFKRMIRDFETSARHEDILKKIKKKHMAESKKYQETIKHMKELKEETYQKKNEELKQKLKKKDMILITSLENKQSLPIEHVVDSKTTIDKFLADVTLFPITQVDCKPILIIPAILELFPICKIDLGALKITLKFLRSHPLPTINSPFKPHTLFKSIIDVESI